MPGANPWPAPRQGSRCRQTLHRHGPCAGARLRAARPGHLAKPLQARPAGCQCAPGGLRGVVAAQQRQYGRRLLPICRLHRLLRHYAAPAWRAADWRDIATGHCGRPAREVPDRRRCPATPGRRGRLDAIRRADRSGGRNRSAALCHGYEVGTPVRKFVLRARPSTAVFWHP